MASGGGVCPRTVPCFHLPLDGQCLVQVSRSDADHAQQGGDADFLHWIWRHRPFKGVLRHWCQCGIPPGAFAPRSIGSTDERSAEGSTLPPARVGVSSKFAATWFNSGVPSAAPLQKRGVVETPGAPPDATTGVSSQRLRRRVRCRPSGICWRRMPRRWILAWHCCWRRQG